MRSYAAGLIPMRLGLAKPLELQSLCKNQNMTNTSVNLNGYDKILSLATASKNPHTLCCGGGVALYDDAKLIPMRRVLTKSLESQSLCKNQNMTNPSVNLNDHDKILSLVTASKNPDTLCCGGGV